MSVFAIYWIALIGLLVLVVATVGFLILYFVIKTAVRAGTREALAEAGLSGQSIRCAISDGKQEAMNKPTFQYPKEQHKSVPDIPLQPPPNFGNFTS